MEGGHEGGGWRVGDGEGSIGRGRLGGGNGEGEEGNGNGETGMGRGQQGGGDGGNREGGKRGKHMECLGGMRLQSFLTNGYFGYPCNAGYPS